MKRKISLSILSLSLCCTLMAQVKKPAAAKGEAAKTMHSGAVAPTLKNNADSLSYAIGVSVANFYKKQNITDINNAMVTRAINDVMRNGKVLLDDQQANACIGMSVQKAQASKASGNKKAGMDFLAANKNKPGVITLPSGLQYTVIKEGTGPKPAITDKIKCHYHGTLIDGTVFDSSVERGQPIELEVNHVIPGWTEALQLMSVGSKWKLFVPSNLAYGDQSPSQAIPAGSTLVFDVELLDIVK